MSEQLLICLPEPWLSYYRPAVDVAIAALPYLSSVSVDEMNSDANICYALALAPPAGLLTKLDQLKVIMPVGAGVEHLLADPHLPRAVPIVRFVQQDMVMRMSEYVVQHVLNHHRRARELRKQQHERRWQLHEQPAASERIVGIMGMGTLGQDAALKLRAIGFQVRGWSTSRKGLPGIESFAGASELAAFLSDCEILVCLLPLTTATRHLINHELLELLPPGASIINAARGAIINDEDLISALDDEQLTEATLDAFAVEPLPPDHVYWAHPRVTVTPHCASAVTAEALAKKVVDTITRVRKGKALENVVDRNAGY